MRSSRLWIVAIFFAIVITTLVGLWLAIEVAFGADVDGVCLTHQQASVAYPKQYLYWRTPRHCWSNKPGHFTSRTAVYGRTNSLKLAAGPLDGSGNVVHHSGRPVMVEAGPTIAYPALITGGGTDDSMLRPDPATTWVTVADFDLEPPPFLPWQERVAAAFDPHE